ncbi:hypothetical protein X801_08508 [Opisthorchis viverrini]|uniref:Uncharacterized protein n=1 Tax=Opisthorchis viverrini TaxID=6198 RepID=A0A1S8WMN9_OPIVI|nr:hypothetical protein X801_08508 [Opisthorchis viverrini]
MTPKFVRPPSLPSFCRPANKILTSYPRNRRFIWIGSLHALHTTYTSQVRIFTEEVDGRKESNCPFHEISIHLAISESVQITPSLG